MAERERIRVDDRVIAVMRAGKGPPLLLLHGIGGNATQWRRQLDGLADTFGVIAWDAPGYVGSDDPVDDWTIADYADSVAGLLDRLELDRIHLLGQSWGGVIAQEFSARHPERLRSLILANTRPGGASQPEPERQRSLQARLTALATMTPAEMAKARAPVLLAPNSSSELLTEVETMLAEIRPSGYRQAAIALANADERPILSRVTVPTLVIAGEHDHVVPLEVSEFIRDAIPGARLAIINGAGHLCNQELPDAFDTVVRDFLTGVDMGAG